MSDPAQAAPGVTRALVAAGADVLSITEPRHTLDDVYLELINNPRGPVTMNISVARVGAVIRKELAEFRRSRFVMATMGIIPVIFLAGPTAAILSIKQSAPSASLDQGSASCCRTCW